MDPDKARLRITIETSRNACAGAAAAFVFRSVAARAGSYAPGIDERLFFDLSRQGNGRDLDRVEAWFGAFGGELSRLGYRVLCRRTAAPTPEIMAWVRASDGYRGAVLATDGALIHGETFTVSHAVAIARMHGTAGTDVVTPGSPDGLIIADPWFVAPASPDAAPQPRSPVSPDVLDLAHRDCKYGTLLLFWAGHS